MGNRPPDDGYTWPTAPAGARYRAVRPLTPPERRRAARTGALAGVGYVVAVVGLHVLAWIDGRVSVSALAVAVVAALGALMAPRKRPFARGFLVAVLVCSLLLVVALFVLLWIQLTTGGPKPYR